MGPNKGRGARGEKLPEGGRWGPRGIRFFMGRGGGLQKFFGGTKSMRDILLYSSVQTVH